MNQPDDSEARHRLGLGIVGLGVATKLMMPTLLSDDRIELVAVAEPLEAARSAFVREHRVRGFADLEGLLAVPDVEAVYLATPHALHAEQAVAVLRSGRDVLVEKPLGLTVTECERVAEVAEETGRAVVVGHTHAFDRPIRAMRAILDSGRLGNVLMVSNWMFNDFLYRPRRPEELDTTKGGGVVFNQLPHQVDVARLLAGGTVRSVRSSAYVVDAARPTEGSMTTFLDFDGGASASLVYSGHDFFDSDELFGWVAESGRRKEPTNGAGRRALEAGRAEVSEGELRRRAGYTSGLAGAPAEGHPHFGLLVVNAEHGDLRTTPSGIMLYDTNGAHPIDIPVESTTPDRHTVVDDLYAASVLGIPSVHTARWGAETLEVCLAALRSSRERREIMLPSRSRGVEVVTSAASSD